MKMMLQGRRTVLMSLLIVPTFLLVGCSPKQEGSDSKVSSSSAVKTSQNLAKSVDGATKRAPAQSPKPISNDASTKLVPTKDNTVAPSKLPEGKVPEENGDTNSKASAEEDVSVEFLSGIPQPPKGLNILAVAAVESLDRIESVITLINGAPKKKGDIAREAVLDFQKKFGFKDASWLRSDKPLYVMLSDINESTGGRALVLPITDKKSVATALKDFKKKGSKHLGELSVDGKKAYVDLIGEQVVISYTDTFFSRLEPYLKGAFKGYTPKGVVELQLNVQTLRTMYGKDLSGSKGWIQKNITDLLNLEKLEGLQGGNIDDIVELVSGFIESVSEAGIALTLDKKGISLVGGILPEKGQGLDKIIAGMKDLRSQLASAIHPQALVALTANAGPLALLDGRTESQQIVSMLAPIAKLDAKETAQLLDLLEKRRLNQLGDGMFQVYEDGAFPMAIGGASIVKDSDVERQAHQGILDMVFQVLMKNLRKQMKDNKMASLFLRSKSFSDLFKSASILTNPMGISLDVSSRELKGTKIDAFTIKIDWEKSPLVARIPNADLFKKVVGNRLSIAAAYRGQRIAIGFGPNAPEHTRNMVEGKGFGGQPSLTKALKSHAIAGQMRLGAIAKLLLQFSQQRTPELLALSTMKEGTSIQAKVKSNGSKAMFRVTVPAPLFRVFR